MKFFQIGWLLGLRQIQHANIWTNILIIFVMMLTFLNLVAVSGILVGLIEGSEKAFREQYIGDLLISPLADEDHILDTPSIAATLEHFPEIASYSVRSQAGASLEANYQIRRDLSASRDVASGSINGIDPAKETATTNLSKNMVEGEFIDATESGYIVLGAYLLEKYAAGFGDTFDSLSNVEVGDKVRVTGSGGTAREFIVKGIIKSKVDTVSLSAYITQADFQRLFKRYDRSADEISIVLKPGYNDKAVKAGLLASGVGELAKVQTFSEGLPKFLLDIKNTFNLLGTFVGSIGIVVASITIFIIIFINALTRQRYIGILKAVGVDRHAIEWAYIVQSAFYAISGSLLGFLLTFGFLVPYFNANPINFPFSDGILSVTLTGTFIRFIILLIITLLAGFIPARLITRRNTLNSILGR